MCKIHLGTHGALHVTVLNEWTYGGVYAAYLFPVAHDREFISLLQSLGEGKDIEVGVIRDIEAFPREQAELVRAALRRRYFIHKVLKIHEVSWKFGFVWMDVETDKGRAQFYVRWKTDRTVDYGRRGKIVIDVSDNRYLIPDLDQLSPRERAAFTRYIYW
jgi:hypothetical protein